MRGWWGGVEEAASGKTLQQCISGRLRCCDSPPVPEGVLKQSTFNCKVDAVQIINRPMKAAGSRPGWDGGGGHSETIVCVVCL